MAAVRMLDESVFVRPPSSCDAALQRLRRGQRSQAPQRQAGYKTASDQSQNIKSTLAIKEPSTQDVL